MTIYLDLVFLLNLFFDFLLLLTVNNTLRRNASLKRIFLGSLIGSLTILLLFLPMPNTFLFLFKIIVSVFMVVISFGLKDKAYFIANLTYFYMTSTVLGGFMYFLCLSFSEEQTGLLFSYHNMAIPYLFVVITSPLMLYVYYKERKEISYYQNFYDIKISFLNGQEKIFHSYLDTGNKLKDPVTKKKILVVSGKSLKDIPKDKICYVPYNALNTHGLMKCLFIKKIDINGLERKDYLVGISEEKLMKEGVECILNNSVREDFLC